MINKNDKKALAQALFLLALIVVVLVFTGIVVNAMDIPACIY